jgi:hypothetical protein
MVIRACPITHLPVDLKARGRLAFSGCDMIAENIETGEFDMNKNKLILPILLFVMSITISACQQTELGESSASQPNSETKTELLETSVEIATSQADLHDLQWATKLFSERGTEVYSFEPDVIYPINHIQIEYLPEYGACEFLLHGYYGAKEPGDKMPIHYSAFYCIEIRSMDGAFHQILDGFSTFLPHYGDYGFTLADWNQDGAIDIKLREWEGGTMQNQPSLFWLWDMDAGKYIKNEQLGYLSGVSTINLVGEENRRLCSHTRIGPGEYGDSYYEYIDGEFVEAEYQYSYVEIVGEQKFWVTEISKPMDGEMQIVEIQKKTAN